jgi:hypothetical protein
LEHRRAKQVLPSGREEMMGIKGKKVKKCVHMYVSPENDIC